MVRVRRVRESAQRRLTLAPHVAWAGPRGGAMAANGAAPAPATPALLAIDAPALPGAEDDIRPLAAVRVSPWPGEVTLFIGDAAATATQRATASASAAFGALEWALWPGPVGRFDRGNRVRVSLPGAVLASVAERALLDGANAFAVQAGDGIWEVFQARDAVLISAGVYEPSWLLRAPTGRRPGAGAIPAGAPIVALDARLARLSLQSHEAGVPLALFAPPPGRAPSHTGAAQTTFEWGQAALTPLAPTHLRAAGLANGDTQISWIRCARLGGDAWGASEPPQEPEGEAYQVEILRNGAVVRTQVVSMASFLYSAADRATDFASAGAASARVRQRGAGGRLGWGAHSPL